MRNKLRATLLLLLVAAVAAALSAQQDSVNFRANGLWVASAQYLDFTNSNVRVTAGGLANAPDVTSAVNGTFTLVPVQPDSADDDTGIAHGAAANQLSLVAGGAEGIRVEATRATFAGRILGKQGADVASANDVTLGNGNYFDVTGTTQINTIAATNWTLGSVVILQFDGAVTVANNTAGTGAKVLLAGGVDFAATANDTLTLVYDGVTWRETARAVI